MTAVKVCISGNGHSETSVRLLEMLRLLNIQINARFMESVKLIEDMIHALRDIDKCVVDVLNRHGVEVWEASILPVYNPIPWIKPVPVHARYPPWRACTEHPKKSGIY